jgi:hypothetical protein
MFIHAHGMWYIYRRTMWELGRLGPNFVNKMKLDDFVVDMDNAHFDQNIAYYLTWRV